MPQDVGILRQFQMRRVSVSRFLDLAVCRTADPPVGDGGGTDGKIGRKRRLAGGKHLLCCLHRHQFDIWRRRQGDRPADEGYTCPAAGKRGGDGVALLARRSVGDEPYGIDWFNGRTRSDDGMASGKRSLAARKAGKGGFDDDFRLAEPARTLLAAGHVSGARPNKCNAAACSRARFSCVAAWLHIAGFIAGAISTGAVVASRIVVADRPQARSPRAPSGCCRRRHQHEIGFTGKADMPHLGLVGQREQVRIGFSPVRADRLSGVMNSRARRSSRR